MLQRRSAPAIAAPRLGAVWIWCAHMVWTSYLSLVAHRCCHGDPRNVPWLVRAAQNAGVLLSREMHRIHHRTFAVSEGALHLTTFHAGGNGYGWSFYNGWAAPVLDALSLRLHYSDPCVLGLTFGLANNLPLLLLVACHSFSRCGAISWLSQRPWRRTAASKSPDSFVSSHSRRRVVTTRTWVATISVVVAYVAYFAADFRVVVRIVRATLRDAFDGGGFEDIANSTVTGRGNGLRYLQALIREECRYTPSPTTVTLPVYHG